jgi:hypothetical protein
MLYLFSTLAVAAISVSSPIIVGTKAQMTQGTLAGTQLDGPISMLATPDYWISSQWDHVNSDIKHTMAQGSLNSPFNSVAWTKTTCHRDTTPSKYCINGPYTAFTNIVPSDVVSLWFTSTYRPQPANGSLLAFIHEEKVANSGSGTNENPEGKTRIGLAWSNDGGNNWSYLGRIISPYQDPNKLNIQGVPYLIKDGYFYIYFVDSLTGQSGDVPGSMGIAVARASVSSVIAAAQSGSVGTNLWQKYHNGSFSTPGLGGQPSAIGPWGIVHTQAAYSSYTGKYYLLLSSMTWGGGNTYVKLFESTDAISWTLATTIAQEGATTQRPNGGYQYCSIADINGVTNAEVGQKFYVYCMKDPLVDHTNFGLYRWEINLGATADFYRQSANFSTAQGPNWFYQYGYGSSILNMALQGSYWQGTDVNSRIYVDSVHPGWTEIPVLKWVAPKAGTVRIEGTVRKADPTCGDGIIASLVHVGTEIFRTSVGTADTVGVSHNILRTVAAGDGLFFMVAGNATNYCDSTRWDPSVTYQ